MGWSNRLAKESSIGDCPPVLRQTQWGASDAVMYSLALIPPYSVVASRVLCGVTCTAPNAVRCKWAISNLAVRATGDRRVGLRPPRDDKWYYVISNPGGVRNLDVTEARFFAPLEMTEIVGVKHPVCIEICQVSSLQDAFPVIFILRNLDATGGRFLASLEMTEIVGVKHPVCIEICQVLSLPDALPNDFLLEMTIGECGWVD